MSAWLIKMMKIFHPLVIGIYLILSGATTYASDFEDTWYGFQKFLAKKDQTTWFLQCGYKYDGEFNAWHNYKLIKMRSNISIYKDVDDRWQLIDATIGASKIMLNKSEREGTVNESDVECIPSSSCPLLMDPLVNVFRDFLPENKSLSSFNFDEYFEIRNKITVRDSIRLDDGFMDIGHGRSKEQIIVLSLPI